MECGLGLGIYLMSRLQNNDSKFITKIMDEVSLSYQPKSMMILKKDLIDSILNLRNYVEKKSKLWYTIINESSIEKEWVEENIKLLKF